MLTIKRLFSGNKRFGFDIFKFLKSTIIFQIFLNALKWRKFRVLQ